MYTYKNLKARIITDKKVKYFDVKKKGRNSGVLHFKYGLMGYLTGIHKPKLGSKADEDKSIMIKQPKIRR